MNKTNLRNFLWMLWQIMFAGGFATPVLLTFFSMFNEKSDINTIIVIDIILVAIAGFIMGIILTIIYTDKDGEWKILA